MSRVGPFQFARAVQSACDRSGFVAGYDVQILDDTVVNRVALSYGDFIDAFYNADTGKCSYVLVEEGTRVFGADNAYIGWYLHPVEDPGQHVPSPALSFDDFLKAVEEYAAKKQG